ncbi:MAG: NADPH-dependent oxidoreductase [Caldilineae bacterium]|nr:MAG: NADPH-dependent oxidoreductase [Caldilineae bacterium]
MNKADTKEVIKVVGIAGSLRPGSLTREAVRLALAGAAEIGARTELIDLREYDLVFCDGTRSEGERAPDVLKLRQKVREAQGIILGTPEYHGSFSGALKNALDLMSFDEFGGKVVGLVGTSGGAMGAVNALNSLRLVGRSLHAWVIPLQVSIAEAWKQFDEQKRLRDDKLAARVREVGRQVARFAYLHHSRQAQDFLRLWEEAPQNPGAE